MLTKQLLSNRVCGLPLLLRLHLILFWFTRLNGIIKSPLSLLENMNIIINTCKIRQHGGQGDGQQDQSDTEALPGAPVLTSFVYVESGRGIGRVVGIVRCGSRSQWEDRHN